MEHRQGLGPSQFDTGGEGRLVVSPFIQGGQAAAAVRLAIFALGMAVFVRNHTCSPQDTHHIRQTSSFMHKISGPATA